MHLGSMHSPRLRSLCAPLSLSLSPTEILRVPEGLSVQRAIAAAAATLSLGGTSLYQQRHRGAETLWDLVACARLYYIIVIDSGTVYDDDDEDAVSLKQYELITACYSSAPL